MTGKNIAPLSPARVRSHFCSHTLSLKCTLAEWERVNERMRVRVCVRNLCKLTVRQNPRAIYFHTNTDAIDVFHHNLNIQWPIRSMRIWQIQTVMCRWHFVR